jgi:hypothetical protein
MDGSLILKWIFKKWNPGGMDQIFLAHDRDRRQAFVNAKLLGCIKCGQCPD